MNGWPRSVDDCAQSKWRYQAAKPSVHVLDLLKTTKLDGVFDIHEDETAAIQSFSRSAGNCVIRVLPCCPIPGAKYLPSSSRRRRWPKNPSGLAKHISG
jgi:hypothetical protein